MDGMGQEPLVGMLLKIDARLVLECKPATPGTVICTAVLSIFIENSYGRLQFAC